MEFSLKMIKRYMFLFLLLLSGLNASSSFDFPYEAFNGIPKKVLIIDNSHEDTTEFQNMITKYYNYRFASKAIFAVETLGSDGIKMFDLLQPDLIFVDHEFSDDVTGVDIVKHIRKTKKNPVRIFACSDDLMDCMKMYRYGADIVLTKTIEKDELEEVFDYAFFGIPFKPIAPKPKGSISKFIKKIFK